MARRKRRGKRSKAADLAADDASVAPILEWRLFSTSQREVVADELEDLNVRGLAKIQKAMDRRLAGESLSQENQKLPGTELWELRVEASGQQFRVFYGVDGDAGVLLAVKAFEKKSRKSPKRAIDSAHQRWADWQGRDQGD